MILSYGITDVGRKRSENQDRFAVDDRLGFYVVADGMGGQRHGELAAEIAISTMKYYIESSCDRLDVSWPYGYDLNLSADANRLSTATRLANHHVWKRTEENPEYVGMGTTVAAVLINQMNAAVANVGDSRIYHLRGGKLQQISTDDTWINEILRNPARGGPSINIKNHPMANVLSQSIGSKDDVNVHILDFELQTGDFLLLSSDGLHGVISDDEIGSRLTQTTDLAATGKQFIDAVLERGAPDNVTVIILKVG